MIWLLVAGVAWFAVVGWLYCCCVLAARANRRMTALIRKLEEQ